VWVEGDPDGVRCDVQECLRRGGPRALEEVLADGKGVWAVIASPKEVLTDPQVLANEYLVPNKDDDGGSTTW